MRLQSLEIENEVLKLRNEFLEEANKNLWKTIKQTTDLADIAVKLYKRTKIELSADLNVEKAMKL